MFEWLFGKKEKRTVDNVITRNAPELLLGFKDMKIGSLEFEVNCKEQEIVRLENRLTNGKEELEEYKEENERLAKLLEQYDYDI
jgi:hypothetical protein